MKAMPPDAFHPLQERIFRIERSTQPGQKGVNFGHLVLHLFSCRSPRKQAQVVRNVTEAGWSSLCLWHSCELMPECGRFALGLFFGTAFQQRLPQYGQGTRKGQPQDSLESCTDRRPRPGAGAPAIPASGTTARSARRLPCRLPQAARAVHRPQRCLA